jgi:hypothetical protein
MYLNGSVLELFIKAAVDDDPRYVPLLYRPGFVSHTGSIAYYIFVSSPSSCSGGKLEDSGSSAG